MATLDSDDLDAIAGLIEAVITTGDMEGIRHRLGLDGTATAPTTPGAKLGNLELTQMKIDSSAEVGKIPLRLISDDGTSFEFVDTFHGQSMSWSAEENALVVGNILANLLGKVLGQGSGVITGVGVQADVSSASTDAIRDGLATGAKQEEILGAIAGADVIQVASPNVDGNLVLTQGDTYDGIGNPKATWNVGTDYTDGWSVMLTIRDKDDAVVYQTAGVVVSATVITVAIDAPTGLPMIGCPGQWQGKFDVELSKGVEPNRSVKTVVLGACYINEDQTR
jgi:hypothetical protein